MDLPVRPSPQVFPDYSLTGDLISYERCHRQYRYYNGSSLPPSRPVQLWYGEFIHGILEQAYLFWKTHKPPFPWPYTELERSATPGPPPADLLPHDVRTLGWPVEEALQRQGRQARSREARAAAYRRASSAINYVGPHLFQLVASNEEKVIGTRRIPDGIAMPRSTFYGLKGVIDVLTNIEFGKAPEDNAIREAVTAVCGELSGEFEVVVDYKGERRPLVDSARWRLGEWQVLTYAWLRSQQPISKPVAASLLIYINELAPQSSDFAELLKEVKANTTDVVPKAGSSDFYQLFTYTPGTTPELSLRYRLQRAIRVIPVTDEAVEKATTEFDRIVMQIERRVAQEAATSEIRSVWEPKSDRATCVACDFKLGCEFAVGKGYASDDY